MSDVTKIVRYVINLQYVVLYSLNVTNYLFKVVMEIIVLPLIK